MRPNSLTKYRALKETASEVAWDAIPYSRVPLRGHYRARIVRFDAFYMPCVAGYIAVAAGGGMVELQIAQLAPQDGMSSEYATMVALTNLATLIHDQVRCGSPGRA